MFGLDHQRVGYRYHHLFASLLQSRLRAVAPDSVKLLHRRASRWLSENGHFTEAITQAMAALDHEEAADLMERHHVALFSHGRMHTALTWSRQLPETVLAQRPLLSLICAWGNLYLDDLSELERDIGIAEQCVAGVHDAPRGSKERAMLGQVALLRGCQSAYQGKIEEGMAHLAAAQASFAPEQTLHRAADVVLGVFHFVSGRLDESQLLFEQNVGVGEGTYNVLVPITAALGLARSHLLRGRLLAAKQVYDKTMQACLACGWQDFPACGMLHIGLGEVAYEMNELVLAEQHLVRGIALTGAGMQYANTWGRVLLAQTRTGLGAAAEAADPQFELLLLRYAGRPVVEIAPLSAVIARYWLSLGRMDAVQLWSEAADLPVEEALVPGREAEYLVLVRYLIAAERRSLALDLLERLWHPALQGKRQAVMVEILALKALCLQAEARSDEAMAVLQEGVCLAENTHLLRVFINEGSTMESMLRKLARGADYKSYVHTLLGHVGADAARDATQAFDPLPLLFSKKEKQVVSHIARGATNHEIAEQLFISPNTLNSHVKKIYAKLGVNSRLQAAERLRQLGLSA
jgi:LuxR family transcriptional regulator, maltose regulon positive regulatory protein